MFCLFFVFPDIQDMVLMSICLDNIQRVHFMAPCPTEVTRAHLRIEKYMRNGITLIQFPVYSTACGIIMKTHLQIQLQREKLNPCLFKT